MTATQDEKYLIFTEGGDVYITEQYTEENFNELGEIIYAIIRLADNKTLKTNGEWVEIMKW